MHSNTDAVSLSIFPLPVYAVCAHIHMDIWKIREIEMPLFASFFFPFYLYYMYVAVPLGACAVSRE